jgi:hypothetical protein
MKVVGTLITQAFKFIDKQAERLADLVISKPGKEENKPAEQDALETAATAGASYAATRALTVGAISATETLASYGAGTTVVQGAATVAAAGTELLAAPTTAVSTIAAAESVPLALAAGAVLFFAYTGGKVAGRAVGRGYEYLSGNNSENATVTKSKVTEPKDLIMPKELEAMMAGSSDAIKENDQQGSKPKMMTAAPAA